MRRFVITSSKFKGQVEALYNLKQLLFRVDFNAAELTKEGIAYIKHRIPVHEENIYDAFKETGITAIEADFEVSFDDFKREYPYKRNTHLAEAYWPRLTSSQQYQAFIAAIDYRAHCAKNKSWYKPMIAETWLKKEEYRNDWKNM
ncbi:MAG: hypothetical protein Q8K66_13240 [Sediminibacterium sp.]|nr:hypothetical protein [Sediminibacterium sp.]MDP3128800.1 hypothetical protein [Sediminibacterium sp.]